MYGNEGFNPSVRPTRSTAINRHNEADLATEGESDGDNRSNHTSSSPERYLSDYDDEDWSPADGDTEMRKQMSTRVRQGSEGWEVRPSEWGVDLNDVERRSGRPWEVKGRYQVYEPQPDLDHDGNSDEWGDSGKGELNTGGSV